MKYKTIIETDDFEDFEFFEDGNGKYIVGKDAGTENDEWIALYFTECEQEPKTGHWIEVTNGRGGHECDVCHDYAPSYKNGDEHLSDFCPNCGAKMVEPQESEDKK